MVTTMMTMMLRMMLVMVLRKLILGFRVWGVMPLNPAPWTLSPKASIIMMIMVILNLNPERKTQIPRIIIIIIIINPILIIIIKK